MPNKNYRIINDVLLSLKMIVMAMIILKYLTNTEYFCICSKREVFL